MRSLFRRQLRLFWQEEGGYSLVEVTTALTLFIGILVPLSGALAYWMTHTRNEHEIHALALGQHYMATTIQEANFASEQEWVEDYTWRLSRTVLHNEPRVTVLVRVYYREQDEPLVELMTQRLLQ